MSNESGWNSVDWREVAGSAIASGVIGMIKVLMLLRKGRKIKWFDPLLECSLAVLGGMVLWALSEVAKVPDIAQAVATSVGAWGGTRTIHWAEKKYLGGSRSTDFADLEEKK